MELPLQITFRDMQSSPAVEADIGKYAGKLEKRYGRIVSCRVAVQHRHKNRRKGNLYRVSVDLKIPGKEIAVTSAGPKDHAHEDLHVAIRDVFDSVSRRLEEHARIRQGTVKTKTPPDHGRVIKLFPDEGYGFAETPDGSEIYFHKNSVANGRFGKLKKGQEVRMSVEPGDRGPQASVVKPVGKHSPGG